MSIYIGFKTPEVGANVRGPCGTREVHRRCRGEWPLDGAYTYCVTHQGSLLTKGQELEHTKDAWLEECLLIRVCPVHGYETEYTG